MKIIFIIGALAVLPVLSRAQQYPNNNFTKWNEWGCPEDWNCNNDSDCKGKVTRADKVKGGAKLTVTHCWNPEKDDRSNNVNMSYDDLSAQIPKGKKVKVVFIYSYVPVANDVAYIKIDADFSEQVNNAMPAFLYNGGKDGNLAAGSNLAVTCQLNFSPANGKEFVAPQNVHANSIRTTIGIMPAAGSTDVHKGTSLILHTIKFEIE